MKTYTFQNKTIVTENLNGKEIAEAEKKYGLLLFVAEGTRIVPVKYDARAKDVKELSRFKRRKKDGFEKSCSVD